MFKYLFFSLLIVVSANAEIIRSLEIGSMNPAPIVIDGSQFPRLKEIKYRGVSEAQYDSKKAITAMLGADAHIESILFSGIKLLLMKEKCAFCSTIASSLTDRRFLKLAEEAIVRNGGNPYSEAKAKELAFRMMEDELLYRLQARKFIDEKVDYRSQHYEMFPQDIVFSTIHPEVANIYSKSIAVIEGNSKDYLDLNYWNKIENGSFLFIQRKWADRGEFITPILINASHVDGFLEYLTQSPDYTVYRPLPAELDFAFMRAKETDEKLVLVFDGKINGRERAVALVEQQKQFVFAESKFDPMVDVPKLLNPLKEKPSLIGIFKLCPIKTPCKLTSSYFKKYKRSRRSLNKNLIDAVTNTEIKGMIPKLFFAEGTLKPSEPVSKIYVPEALPSAELMNSLQKAEKFSSSDRVTNPTSEQNLKVTWDLQGKKLLPGGAIYLDIPDKYRRLKLKRVTLFQRQDQKDNTTPLQGNFDKSPAYTSVQFYAINDDLDENWRFLPNPNKFNPPKDAFFADLVPADRMRPASIILQDISKGHNSEKEHSESLIIAGVRLLGLGTDAATLHKLELEFEE